MQALENPKELVGVLLVETSAVVANEIRGYAAAFALAHFDHGVLAAAREFDGVREEIREDDFDQAGVAVRVYERLDQPFDLALVRFGMEFGDHLADHIHRDGFFPSRLRGGRCGEIDQIVHQSPHVVRGSQHSIEVANPFGRELGGVLLLEDAGEAVDVAEGSAKVVGNGIAERLEFLVGDVQLRDPVL